MAIANPGQHSGAMMQRPRQRSASSAGGAYLMKVILVRAMTEAIIAASDVTRYPPQA